MITTAFKSKIITQLDKLRPDQQKKVLIFAQSLSEEEPPGGVPGEKLLSYAGCIDADDLEVMAKAIEEGCEKVDPNEW